MKMKQFPINILSIVVLLLLTSTLFAQYDDIYYNPDEDYKPQEEQTEIIEREITDEREAEETYVRRNFDEDDYYEDDYDYYYSSRIRRFHRSYRGFGYFSNCYVDRYYYNPFRPGVSIYVGNGWQVFAGQPFPRPFMSPWYNPWMNWGYAYHSHFNNFGYNPYFYNNYYGYGWNNGWRNGWNNGWDAFDNGYYTEHVNNNSYYGARHRTNTNSSNISVNTRPDGKIDRTSAPRPNAHTATGRTPITGVSSSKVPNNAGLIDGEGKAPSRSVGTIAPKGEDRTNTANNAATIDPESAPSKQTSSGSKRSEMDAASNSTKDKSRSNSGSWKGDSDRSIKPSKKTPSNYSSTTKRNKSSYKSSKYSAPRSNNSSRSNTNRSSGSRSTSKGSRSGGGRSSSGKGSRGSSRGGRNN